ncbi:MAG: efflux RND transporter permease subunit [Proteobacteria bacterium]|nr:efflux RND transporter permease subunit [Pseudomonadota bacterium]
MWFTKVSLNNPVFATMVMLAFVVLGLFSLQRLQVDQFPNIDFPVVVVTTEYPGAAPPIVESEVTKKIEEAVNAIAGINALTSRSYEGMSVVIIEFQLHIDGRKAADDVREKIGQVRPLLRDEVKEPRVLRFDPASRAIWSLAVLPDPQPGRQALSPVELTNWADQVLKKRLENVRGVGAVNLAGGAKREIHIDLKPQALEALGITPEQVMAAVRSENQDQPLGPVRNRTQELTVQLDGRMTRPEDFNRIIVARRGGSPVYLEQVARVRDGAQELESLALYNGQRTLLVSVQKAQDENTIQVVDGLNQALRALTPELPPGLRLVVVGRIYDERYHALLLDMAQGKEVRFVHDADDARLVDLYRSAAVLVQASTARDIFGNVIEKPELMGLTTLEAMACGLPALVSDAGSLPELVPDARFGRVFASDDELAALLAEVAAGRWPAPGAARQAREHVVATHGMAAIGQRLAAAYRAARAEPRWRG